MSARKNVQGSPTEVGVATDPSPEVFAAAGGSGLPADVLKLAVCAGSGVVFGFAAEKGRVFLPAAIQNQMIFSQFTMMKMFLSAVTAGLGSFVVLNLLPPTHNMFSKMRNNFGCCVKRKTVTAIAVGGTLLGVGMALSGACPGMVFSQVGAGTQNAWYTLAGCFAGALLYGAIEPALNTLLFLKSDPSPDQVWVDKQLGVSYTSIALPLAIVLGGITLTLEHFIPWTTEVTVSPPAVGIFEQQSWSPIIAGLLIGSLQLSVVFSVGDSLGGSSSYCTLLSNVLKNDQVLSYFASFRRGIGNWWQVVFWLGAVAGAGLSAYLSGTWGTTTGVSPTLGFLGGAAMLLGARMASGCTSGHGLSGISLLSVSSFLVVPAMFGGGMGLAFTMLKFT